MILVYNTLIYACKEKEVNDKKCASNNSNAVHILGHDGKGSIFAEKGKIRLKKQKKKDIKWVKVHQKIKNSKVFTISGKGTFIHVTMHERPKICPALYKMHKLQMKYSLFAYFLC